MSSYGWMIGLGEGLQQVGGMMMDYNKEKVRNQLEVEREQRQVKRELDKEQRAVERELTTPTAWNPTKDDAGNTYLQAFNSHGKPIVGESRPMSTYEAEEFARKQRLAELDVAGKEQTVSNQGLEGQLKGFQVRDYNSDRELKRRREAASIEASLASASASRSRALDGGKSSDKPSPEAHPLEYADAIIKEHKATFERYGVDDGEDQQRIAELAVKGAAAEGISPSQYLLRYLSNMKK